MLTEKIVMI